LIVLAYFTDGVIVRIYDAESGKELWKGEGRLAEFYPDGKRVVTNTGKIVRLYDTESGKELLKGVGVIA
jgi:hypothetical protein